MASARQLRPASTPPGDRPHLRELDEIAYLRFASVYQAFESLEDFEAAIAGLRLHPSTGQLPAVGGATTNETE